MKSLKFNSKNSRIASDIISTIHSKRAIKSYSIVISSSGKTSTTLYF